MKQNKHLEEIKKGLIKKFHTLSAICGLSDEDKKDLVSSYCKSESSKDLTNSDLLKICDFLQIQADKTSGALKQGETLDKMRKRCLKALCSYFEVKNITAINAVSYAKQVACRATQKQNFNKLTRAELAGVIAYFNKEKTAFLNSSNAEKSVEEELLKLINSMTRAQA